MTMNRLSSNERSQQWPQYIAAISSLFLAVSVGLHFGWPSPVKLRLKDLDFQISKEEVSYIVMISPLGYLVGCPVTAFLLDKIGRKSSILILVVPQILACLLIANCTGINMIYAARLSSGISEGGALTSLPVYIGEISDPRIRGALGMGYGVAVMFGSVLINFYGSYMTIKDSAYFSILIPILFLLTFVWMPESPYFCIMKGKIENARRSLKRLRWIDDVEEELAQLTLDVQRQISEPKNVKDIFTVRSNLKAFVILIGIRTLQQFSGGASLNLYNQYIFQQASGSISFVASSVIFHSSLVIVSCCGSLIVDRTGRKPLLMISVTGTAISLFVVGVYFSFQYYKYDVSSLKWVPITFMVLYTIVRGIGIMPIPSVLAGELFSASVKAKAVGIINIYFALCISSSSKLFHWLQDKFGMHVPFFVFVFICVLGIAFLRYCVPETKGKTLEEIQQHLKKVNDQSGIA
ncbi:hypothetical protein ILUMI_13587 [Ignelater luminosus]|uniref:Major facilitator superfamily (MFS) profile domain-containing protein n=1 Tax=Ignelater luminosus TaxID=2038154 RepID=A0A8K0CS38_IGNLU|nr:hypothetical protein ILUMI_13587 [Ignelater luminosus]